MARIVIAGGTGFLGRPLADSFVSDGHDVVILTRTPGAANRTAPGSAAGARHVAWVPDGDVGPWAAEIDGAAAVINLAGESIAARRWTAAHKQRILDSRVLATRSLVAAIGRAETPPSVFVSQSAVGYYGPRGDEVLDETAQPGSDFLATVCVRWEAEAQPAATNRTRLVCLRTGLPLERDGGALPAMLPPFWFGVGGPVGSGRQYWPWIHRDDWIALVRWSIDTTAAAGPLNGTGPAPVTNREFARALGRALRRPAIMPAPRFALRLLLGEMADALLLSGQRAAPAKALRLGFTFRYPTVDDALAALFRR
jgi:uncharacterized protein